jgi:hypothetical protein
VVIVPVIRFLLGTKASKSGATVKRRLLGGVLETEKNRNSGAASLTAGQLYRPDD